MPKAYSSKTQGVPSDQLSKFMLEILFRVLDLLLLVPPKFFHRINRGGYTTIYKMVRLSV
jgi:hypothetical protein